MAELIRKGELVLYGLVGVSDFYGFDGFTATEVINALAELDGDITIRLNSPGGLVPEGIAIYHALKRYPGKKRVMIDAEALSMGSVIAMAGDEIIMPSGTMMMIHAASGVTVGNSQEHRVTADRLDQLTKTVAQIYVERTGLSEAEVTAMLDAETWMDGPQAVAKGFATSTGEEAQIDENATMAALGAFDFSTFKNAPAPLMALVQDRKTKGLPMVAVVSAPLPPEPLINKDNQMSQTTPADPNTPAIVPAPVPPQTPAPVATAKDVTLDIFSRCRAAKMSAEDTEKVIQQAGGDVMKAKDLIIDIMAARDPSPEVRPGPAATVTADARDRFRMGAEKALMSRTGLPGGEVNEFSSLSLKEIARESLTMAGASKKFTDPMQLVGAALGMPSMVMAAGMHSTSDFPIILGNVANKAVLKGYEEAEETFKRWTSKGNLTDFRPTGRIDLNLFPALLEVPEGAEYKFGSVGERGETVQLATYGRMFAITRQAIINDDASVFTRIPQRMGRAAIRTIGDLVYAILTNNPPMSDGKALFHADHKNLVTGAGSALAVSALDAARAAMAMQKDPDNKASAGINIRPKFILVPPQLEGVANVLMNSEFDPSKTQRVPNSARNLGEVISDARLSANPTAWYLAGDPNVYDTIEVSYLNGVETPTLEQREGWNVDGVEFKVRIDAAVKAIDFRALQKNEGA